jgi:bifunctional enzyme CysN/CysC
MAHASDLIGTDIERYLRQHERQPMLRFISCGSVDDGKSTLVGRLLYESKALFEDQLAALAADSRKWGTQGDGLDLALLVDGLAAEREQGITIDVAYRFFSTDRRSFIVADTPGHEQYTRNMVTGASTADVAVILVDARKGVLSQTRRHCTLASLLGIRHVVLAVNKMDLVGYDERIFRAIADDCSRFAATLRFEALVPIPVSALNGDNVVAASAAMPWYQGDTLLSFLETVRIDAAAPLTAPFRFPVQWVNRPHCDFRGLAGTVAGGAVRPGDRVRVLPSGQQTRVARIVTMQGDLDLAVTGQSVTLTLADEIDASRGDMIAAADAPAGVADQFEATLVWMQQEPLFPGRSWLMKIGTQTVTASVTDIKYQLNVNTMERLAAKKIELNGIAVCNIALDRVIAFDAYAENRETGSFIFIDRLSNGTAAAGLLHFALRRADNIRAQQVDVSKGARCAMKQHKACVLWFTGLSGAGKSTISNLVEKRLHAMGKHTYLLDGDNLRLGLNKDLGFTTADRVENIRRVAEVAALMVDAGLIVLTAFISPFKAERQMARSLVGDGEFIEIHVDTPLSVAEQRDPKGLYKKARRGELANFTGIDSPYEAPEAPELRLPGAAQAPQALADRVIALLQERGLLTL